MTKYLGEVEKRLRLPPPHGGINVNFCKNPQCTNFGNPAELEDQRGRRRGNEVSLYKVSGTNTASGSSLFCQACGISSTIKSNLAIHEEFERALELLATPSGLRCTDDTCVNHLKLLDSHPDAYFRHGVTAKGHTRYRCKACRKTFADMKSHQRQQTSHENKTVFQLLVAKVAISKIAQVTGLAPKTVYDKIDFIYDQCLKFIAARERRLPGMDLGNLRIATDMQDYMVNWPTKSMRKTIQFRTIASSCLRTGYVLACQPQLDRRMDTLEVQDAIEECGDLDLRPAFRRYARLWSYEDYARALELDPGTFTPIREDQDSGEQMNEDRQLPRQGAMVHIDYLAFGHYRYLQHLLKSTTGHIHFSIDADPGLSNACLASFKDRFTGGRLDVAVTSCDKRATIDEKNFEVLKAAKLRAVAEDLYPSLYGLEPLFAFYAEDTPELRLKGMQRANALRANFLPYPFIKKSEPGKIVKLLTDDGTRSARDLAEVYHHTSLHQVDRFFMQIRRSIAGLERAPSYPRRAARKWYLYGFYSPEMVEKMLLIFRTYFNFIAKGQDGQTPAMRIGLAKGPVSYEDILYFD